MIDRSRHTSTDDANLTRTNVMSYATMDGSATQFAGQQGYMPECVPRAMTTTTGGDARHRMVMSFERFLFFFLKNSRHRDDREGGS